MICPGDIARVVPTVLLLQIRGKWRVILLNLANVTAGHHFIMPVLLYSNIWIGHVDLETYFLRHINSLGAKV
jgi:hypothetical protein